MQREFATVNLELAELLTEVLISRGKEQRQTQLIEERKASITRLVEEYVRESPVFGDKEKQWMDLGRYWNFYIFSNVSVHAHLLFFQAIFYPVMANFSLIED